MRSRVKLEFYNTDLSSSGAREYFYVMNVSNITYLYINKVHSSYITFCCQITVFHLHSNMVFSWTVFVSGLCCQIAVLCTVSTFVYD